MTEAMLIIEDEVLLRKELQRHFTNRGWDVQLAPDLDAAKRILSDDDTEPLVILADMNLPDGNSLDFLEQLRSRKQALGEWIFLTGYGGVPDSVRAMQLGAYDFLEKPCDRDRLDVVTTGARRSALAQRALSARVRTDVGRYGLRAYVGISPAATEVRELIQRLAEIPLSALIVTGESGTGKGLVTRILHYNGKRADGPMVELNCAALPRDLLEAELLGHEPGAFTDAKGRRRGLLEQAHTGTLFLDEIGELPLDVQAKLLKVIEDKRFRRLGGEKEITVDVQIVAATNRNLRNCVAEGIFRDDLYHRLNVFNLELPPLRSRKEDLNALVTDILADLARQTGKHIRQIPDTVWHKLREYSWPGNVRELRNVLERSVLFSNNGIMSDRWLQLEAPPQVASEDAPRLADADMLPIPLDGSMSLNDIERVVIEAALKRNNNNVSATAQALGATRETIRYRIRKYRLVADG